jgi:hypothetical protein
LTKKDDAKESFLKRIAALFSDQVTSHNPVASQRVLQKLATHKRAQAKHDEGLSVNARVAQAEIQANIVWTRQEEFKEFEKCLSRKSRNRQLAMIGLRLRESHAQTAEVERLLSMVVENYGVAGRRAAQAVECGGLFHLIKELRRAGASPESLQNAVNDFMDRIEALSYFIQQDENPVSVVAAVQRILTATKPPPTFLVSCSGKKAASKVSTVADALETTYSGTYRFYRHQASGEFNAMVLLVRR